jgi:uncharacterized FlaG/YvyC family protein
MAWSQMLMTLSMTKKQQEQAEQQQAQQAQLQQSQEQREQELHDHTLNQAKDAHARAAVNVDLRQQLHDTAKQFGVTKAEHIGGQTMKNPINEGVEE